MYRPPCLKTNMGHSVANKAPHLFTVREGHLVPFDAYTADRLSRFADGATVRCSNLTQPRALPFHNRYWATLSQIVTATECAPSADHLHDWLVKACGYTTMIVDRDGKPVDMVRDSTRFDRMDEPEFQQYVTAAQRMLADRLGIVWDDFTLAARAAA